MYVPKLTFATDETKPLVKCLAASAEIFIVVGPQLCTRIWACAMIDLFKKPLFDWPINLERNSKRTSGKSLSPAASRTWISVLLCRRYQPSLDYACDAGRDQNEQFCYGSFTMATFWYSGSEVNLSHCYMHIANLHINNKKGWDKGDVPPRVPCIPGSRPFFLGFLLLSVFDCEIISIVA